MQIQSIEVKEHEKLTKTIPTFPDENGDMREAWPSEGAGKAQRGGRGVVKRSKCA